MSNIDNPNTTPKATASAIPGFVGVFLAFTAMVFTITALGEWIRRIAHRLDVGNLASNRIADLWPVLLIAVLPFVLLLLFQVAVRSYRRFEPSLLHKGVALLAAGVLAFGGATFLLPAGAQSTLAISVGGGMFIAMLFDLFTEQQETGFTWTVLALIAVNALSASQLWMHHRHQSEVQRSTYATQLATARDTALAEAGLVAFEQALRQDARFPFLLKAWPIKPSADSVRTYLSKLSFDQKYLFRYHKLRTFAFDRSENAPLLLDQAEDRQQINQVWDAAQAIDGQSAIRHDYASSGAHRYIVRATVNRMADPAHPVEVFCFFEESYPRHTQVYSQLFSKQAFKGLDMLERFDYALLRNNQLVVEQGSIEAEAIQSGKTGALERNGRAYQMALSSDGKTTAIVARRAVGLELLGYLFSILFTISTTALIVAGVASRFLPKTTLLPSFKGSLAQRIQYTTLGVLGLGFIGLGFFAYQHFSQNALEKSQKNALERTLAVVSHLRLASSKLAVDSAQQVLGQRLIDFANSLNVDANLYHADGHLLTSSREDLRRIGVLPVRMDAQAQGALDKGTLYVDMNETLDQQTFATKYMAIKDASQRTVAYVGLPSRPEWGRTNQEISDFIGILAFIFASLLLFAVAVTRWVSSTITRPLKNVSEKIKEVQLEDRNEPLQYDGDATDELSGLVAEYNRMVDKLEDSKVKLVKFERESAWRDMARQIAHDIKNPLTTMKLSMQQLERVSNDPSQAAAYLKRATGRLIEQIDSLAQTASEFSMFASLDRTPRFPVDINHLVESVFELFTEQKDVELSLELPKEQYTVMADKNHLLRVLNNLVINAIQAIPSDRQGKVKVALLRIGEHAVIRITDNGGGIPSEIRERVFEPNFTTKTSGSGLGLAICKKIIEAHGGDIRFETRDNEGTEFYVDLPLATA
jgi:two-component system, NtrC family, nitrogen regulation sensor histidine kinase NtrY